MATSNPAVTKAVSAFKSNGIKAQNSDASEQQKWFILAIILSVLVYGKAVIVIIASFATL